MSNSKRRMVIVTQVGLTPPEARREDVRLLAARIVIAEGDLWRLQADLVRRVGAAAREPLAAGPVHLAADRRPLRSTANLSALIDAELVRLDERRAALRIAADYIIASRDAGRGAAASAGPTAPV